MFWYQALIRVLEPLLVLWLYWRRWRGKEHPTRIKERFGHAGIPRPAGTVIWIHAASVGETNSILPLIESLRDANSDWHFLITTTTQTSANRIAQLRDRGANWLSHQFVPVDHPRYVKRFLSHWQPAAALFVESELWPTLIAQARTQTKFMGLINARLSPASFARWSRNRERFQAMLHKFDLILAQDELTNQRLQALGIPGVMMLGNLKLDTPAPTVNQQLLERWENAIGNRTTWLLASSHHDEEALAMRVHHQLSERYPDLLTLIVPRHPERADEIIKLGARRQAKYIRLSETTLPDKTTEFVIGDTIGDMGLFYRLASLCVIGGTFVAHGGQNPLEAARLNCAVLHGPSVENFSEIFSALNESGAAAATSRDALGPTLSHYLRDTAARAAMTEAAQRYLEQHIGTRERVSQQVVTCFQRFGVGHD
jgi:3-deoxy-D-manno-octulosonic-acid transferase